MTAVATTNINQTEINSVLKKLENYDSTQPLVWDQSKPNIVSLTLKDGEKLTFIFPKDTNLGESYLPGRIPNKLEELLALTISNSVVGLGVQQRALAAALNNYFEKHQAVESRQIPKAVAVVESSEAQPAVLSASALPTSPITEASSTNPKVEAILETFQEKWGETEVVESKTKRGGFFSGIRSLANKATKAVGDYFKKSEPTIVTSDAQPPVSIASLVPTRTTAIQVEVDQVLAKGVSSLVNPNIKIDCTVLAPANEISVLVKSLAAAGLKGSTPQDISTVALALGLNPLELDRKQGMILVAPEIAELNQFRLSTGATNSNTLRAKSDQLFNAPIVDWSALESMRLKNSIAPVKVIVPKPITKEDLVVKENTVLTNFSNSDVTSRFSRLVSRISDQAGDLYFIAATKIENSLKALLPTAKPAYVTASLDDSILKKRTWLSAGAAALLSTYALLPFVSTSTQTQAKSSGDSDLDQKPVPAMNLAGNTPKEFDLKGLVAAWQGTVQVKEIALGETSFSGLNALSKNVAEKFKVVAEQHTNAKPLAEIPTVTNNLESPRVLPTKLKANEATAIVNATPATANEVAQASVSIKDFIKIAYYAEIGNNLKSNGKKEFEKANLFAIEQFGPEFDLSKLLAKVKKDSSLTVNIAPEWKSFLDTVRTGAPKKSAENIALANSVAKELIGQAAVAEKSVTLTPQVAPTPEVTPVPEVAPTKPLENKPTVDSGNLDNLPDATVDLEEVSQRDLGLLIRRLAGVNRVGVDLGPSYLVASSIGISAETLELIYSKKEVVAEVSSGISSLIKEMNSGVVSTKALREKFDNLDSQKENKQINWAQVDRLAKENPHVATRNSSEHRVVDSVKQIKTDIQYQYNRPKGLFANTARTIVLSENGSPVAAYTEEGIISRQGTYLFANGVENPRHTQILNEKFEKFSGKKPNPKEF